MLILVILLSLFILFLAYFLIQQNSQAGRLKSLLHRLDLAVKADPPARLGVQLSGIAANLQAKINELIDKIRQQSSQITSLEATLSDNQSSLQSKEKTEVQLEQMHLISRLGRELTNGIETEQIFRKTSDLILSLLPVSEIRLGLDPNEENAWTVFDWTEKQMQRRSVKEDECSDLVQWSLRQKEDAFLPDAAQHFTRYVLKAPCLSQGKIAGSAISFPLVYKGRSVGFLEILSDRNHFLDTVHFRLLQALIPYLNIALDNARVYSELELRNREIEEEKQKSDALLRNILPDEVAEELKAKGETDARLFGNVTVLFTDFVNFTGKSADMSPHDLVSELNECFKAFDRIMELHGMEKIKTIGDAYMAVSGMPTESSEHAIMAIGAAVDIIRYVDSRKRDGSHIFDVRIGLHTGPVVAGIVGLKKFAYDIWGDTVNMASRMESTGEVGEIHISEALYKLIEGRIPCYHRGKVMVKNKGEVDTWFVDLKRYEG